MPPMLAPFGGHMSTQNLMVMSTGGGMHNNPLQSNFIVEVDEFKFSKIISSVLQKNCQPMKESRFNNGSAGAGGSKSDAGDDLVVDA